MYSGVFIVNLYDSNGNQLNDKEVKVRFIESGWTSDTLTTTEVK